MNIIGNLDWSNPLVRAKAKVVGRVRAALGLAGRWTPASPDERTTTQTELLTLSGDWPPQRRLVYRTPRPDAETAENVVYTAAGLAVIDGRVVERFSVRAPSLAEILTAPRAAAVEIAEGTIVEAETPYTYGDWVGDIICALCCAETIVEPLVLPAWIAAKPYVTRDVAALGLAYAVADEPVLIRRTHILRKRLPSYYWRAHEADAYRRAFKITPPEPRKGSILYLARFDTTSESAQRDYPSETVAEIVTAIGGSVFDTRGASPAAFEKIASEAETVIADQGSALFGVLQWRTRTIVELARRHWWHNANICFAEATGVENYAVIAIDGLGADALKTRITGHLRDFGVLKD